MSAHINSRRYDLDWLRIIAFGLLIFYHIGMFYVSWGWHVKSVYASEAAEPLMRILNPWRLSLLFFISGLAIRFAVDKLGSVMLARTRIVQLLVPIIFGMAVIVMPQAYFQLIESGEISMSITEFYPQYLNFGSDFSITTPTWNHLWYIVYLLVYVLLLAPVAPMLSRFMQGAGAGLTDAVFGGKFGWIAVLVIPVLPHLAIRIWLDPHFPTTHDLTSDWANHAHSLTILMTGFLLAKDQAFWRAIERALPWAAGLTLILAIGLTLVWNDWESYAERPVVLWIARVARIAYVWLVIATLLGAGQRWLNKPSRALTYMTEAIFPWYILHQTLIVMAGFWLTRQGLGAWPEFAGVTLATFGGCLLLHELVIRRVGFLRPLFGLKAKSKSAVGVPKPKPA